MSLSLYMVPSGRYHLYSLKMVLTLTSDTKYKKNTSFHGSYNLIMVMHNIIPLVMLHIIWLS